MQSVGRGCSCARRGVDMRRLMWLVRRGGALPAFRAVPLRLLRWGTVNGTGSAGDGSAWRSRASQIRTLRAKASSFSTTTASRTPSTGEDGDQVPGETRRPPEAAFQALGLQREVTTRLPKLGFREPTKVQQLLIPELLQGDRKDVIVGAETGSGKTHAYLLPILHRYLLKREREHEQRTKDSVFALVLVPTLELADQVARFIEDLGLDVVPSILGGAHYSLKDRTGIVVTTPKAFLNRSGSDSFDDMRYLVVDEADMLLEGAFRDDTEVVLVKFRQTVTRQKKYLLMRRGATDVSSHPDDEEPQLVFVGATYPAWVGDKARSIARWIKARYPDALEIHTEQIHRRNPQLEETWLEMDASTDDDAQGSRRKALVKAIESGPDGPVMVFCNQGKSVTAVAAYLSSVPSLQDGVAACHRGVSAADRVQLMNDFRRGSYRVLVCTDIASRGMDLGEVAHVIQYEFSQNVVHYLHRIGRTARAGRTGHATHFFDVQADVLATEIMAAGGGSLENMFSRNQNLNKKRRKLARRLEAGEP